MNTPRMKEAWESPSRTADGFYLTTTPMSVYARSCYEEGCKLERELATVTAQRDRLAEILGDMKTLSEITEQRDRLAEALRECREDSVELLGERDWWQNEPRCDYQKRYQETRDNVTRADEALQSLTTNEEP